LLGFFFKISSFSLRIRGWNNTNYISISNDKNDNSYWKEESLNDLYCKSRQKMGPSESQIFMKTPKIITSTKRVDKRNGVVGSTNVWLMRQEINAGRFDFHFDQLQSTAGSMGFEPVCIQMGLSSGQWLCSLGFRRDKHKHTHHSGQGSLV